VLDGVSEARIIESPPDPTLLSPVVPAASTVEVPVGPSAGGVVRASHPRAPRATRLWGGGGRFDRQTFVPATLTIGPVMGTSYLQGRLDDGSL
jgi:hypothetical protein